MLGMRITTAHGTPVLFDTDFNSQTAGAPPSGWNFSRTEWGSFTVEQREDANYLAVEDFGGDSGPYGLYRFAPMTGANTIHTKFQIVHHSGIEFMPGGANGYNTGIRLNVSSANTLSVESSKNVVYADPLPGYRLPAGTWMELWLTFDTDAGTADLFLQSSVFSGYAGAVGEKGRIVDDYLIVQDIPLSAANIGTLGYGTYKGAGTTLIAFAKGMAGIAPPIAIPKASFDTAFNLQMDGESPLGWEIQRGELGSFTIKQEGGGTSYLAVEDYGGDSGPYGVYRFDPMAGDNTIYAKFQVVQHSSLELMPSGASGFTGGLRFMVSSANSFYIETAAGGRYTEPLPGYRIPAGTWVELWLRYDTNANKADLFLRSDVFGSYRGYVDSLSRISGDYLVIPDIPLEVPNIGTVAYGTYKGAGKTRIEQISGGPGNGAPIDIPEGNDRPDPPEPPDVSRYIADKETVLARLNDYAGTHSRLFVRQNQWSALSAKIQSPQAGELYTQAVQIVQEAMDAPLYVEAGDTSPDENQRHIGDNITAFSFMYKVTGNTDYLDAAVEWTQLALNLSKFGAANNDLASGHILFGMGLMYDWLYDDLDATLKAAIYDKLFERASYMNYIYTHNQKTWTWEYLQNHGWINLTGMITAGLAIYGEDTGNDAEILTWFESAQEFFAHTFTLYGPDGASQEGVGYWSYGVSVLLRYAELAETFFGIDAFSSEWLENTGLYRLYASYPRGGWDIRRTSVNIGDALGYDFNGPTNVLYHLAARYDQPVLLWLADTMLEDGMTWDSADSVWESLLYYDPATQAQLPDNLPALREFEDFGMIFTRSGWQDDASALYFRSGPFLGKQATTYTQAYPAKPDFGSAHMHPDSNGFVLFGGNEVLIRDDGYAYKTTGNHNTLLVNGTGQMGENAAWFNSARDLNLSYAFPEISKTVTAGTYDYFVGASAAAYPGSAGLTKFNRHMLYLKADNILIVADDITAKQEANFELRLFPESQNITPLGNGALVRTGAANLFIDNLVPEESSLSVENLSVKTNIAGASGQRKAVVSRKTGESMLNVTAVSWSGSGAVPAKVSAQQDGRTIIITASGKEYTLDLDTMQVTAGNGGGGAAAPGLTGVLINGIPLEGMTPEQYSYNFDLDDYPLNMRKRDEISVLAIPSGDGMTVETQVPAQFPGQISIRVSAGAQEATYTVSVTGATYHVERLPLFTVEDVNPENPGNLPSAALDGLDSTYWTQNGEGVYVDFDLGGAKEISGFDMGLFRGAERVSYFHLEASGDGESFYEIYRGESSGLTGEPEYYALPQKITARYLRVVGHGNSAGHLWFSISEFGAYRDLEE
jgi:tetratricopeptide (TPR) repeat protein